MNYPGLGKLEQKRALGFYEGQIEVNGSMVGLTIDLDTAPQDAVFNLASKVVTSVQALNEKARNAIARDLLNTYNSGWNEYDEVQEDGATKTVINPQLEASQFSSQFKLASVSICGTDGIEFWYQPNDLFWGHSVLVTSLDGFAFTDINAQLFG